MHSLDHVFSKLTPAEGAVLARAIMNPMARTYRAGDGNMPDPTEDKDKKPPEGGDKKPAMQEGSGAPRDIAAIQADLAKADPTDSALLGKLAVEMREALIAKGIEAQSGPASEPAPAPAPQMGVEQQDAYARGKREAQAEAVKTFVEALEVPDDKRAYLREQPTIAAVKKALAFLPKGAATMGFDGHPAARAKDVDDDAPSVFYPSGNKGTQAAFRVMARKKDGISARGIHKCSPQEQRETGQLMRFSLTEALPHLREVAEENARRDRKAVMNRVGGAE
jgi:hypothetical protein